MWLVVPYRCTQLTHVGYTYVADIAWFPSLQRTLSQPLNGFDNHQCRKHYFDFAVEAVCSSVCVYCRQVQQPQGSLLQAGTVLKTQGLYPQCPPPHPRTPPPVTHGHHLPNPPLPPPQLRHQLHQSSHRHNPALTHEPPPLSPQLR